MKEIEITVFFDSDHAHDQKTRRSISGVMVFLGRTLVSQLCKRQGAVEQSTNSAKFSAGSSVLDEVITIRYMLRCLGVKVTRSSILFGDNFGVIQNCSIKDILMKNKHVDIAYHRV